MIDDPNSKVERVKLQGRETITHLATVDDLIVHRAGNGGLVVEFVVWDKRDKPLESYRLTICPEDAERIRKA
ncbi:hypothetical protein DNX69_00485 [Rhodopseudomonas palustris]|jgi:hypothetical protein|uniref:Uncharacterized protein n=1 Tax=Rhodopseudomonas palustris TaxID=1076 RepID=A0A323UNK6_RHOPL|nr:hypothetical protein [Rhodopseudomonas palustris]PZA13941.1 hypothetical protein DNX69_00485 [Rhodopseudomonas palustris]